MPARVVSVIESKFMVGDGDEDPIREVTEILTLDGKLVCQYDPHQGGTPLPKLDASILKAQDAHEG